MVKDIDANIIGFNDCIDYLFEQPGGIDKRTNILFKTGFLKNNRHMCPGGTGPGLLFIKFRYGLNDYLWELPGKERKCNHIRLIYRTF